MSTTRRNFLARAAGAVAAAGLLPWRAAVAQPAWPAKPVKLINMGPPGSPPDTYARIYAARLAQALGVPVVVDNRPGAGANLASDAVAKAAPDGYTLLYTVSSAFAINPFLYRKLPFDPDKDLRPVSPLLAQGSFMVVNNDLPVTSLHELVAYASSRPGQLAYASYGIGGFAHLIMELLSQAAQVQMLHVPYKAGAMTDLIAGQVQLLVEPAASAIPMIRARKVRAIAFTGPTRHAQFAALPAVAETYPGVASFGWHGVWAPAGVPAEIVQRLNAELTRITGSPEVAMKIRELGSEPLCATPEAMQAMLRAEARKWSALIRAKGISLD
ncbi:MAG: tripartite tricarboxylate transporter substrate binding protein [Cupriavidus sp.]|nr:tripartite tricarboxylate transporter substrate binding protein [Cupriavidus sp.]NUT14628.1 tripartite tricarboxylate transporter substrate binding protein [Cupriavidus sp.]